MKLANLHEMYAGELKYLHNAETQLAAALSRMAEAANDTDLQAVLEEQSAMCSEHAERVHAMLEELGASARGRKCKGMEGILVEGKEMVDAADAPALDAVMIAAAQRAGHYELAIYGCARSYAQALGFADAAVVLDQTEGEKMAADRRLTQIAEMYANRAANGVEMETPLVAM